YGLTGFSDQALIATRGLAEGVSGATASLRHVRSPSWITCIETAVQATRPFARWTSSPSTAFRNSMRARCTASVGVMLGAAARISTTRSTKTFSATEFAASLATECAERAVTYCSRRSEERRVGKEDRLRGWAGAGKMTR